MVKCVEQLDLKNAIFQQLNWNVFNSFSGKYEAILYKLCKDYVGVHRTPYMPIIVFREYMGLRENEYSEFKDLNKFVISGPIRKINESKVADIEIDVEMTKESRRVVGVQFLVKRKNQMDLGFGDDPAFANARITIALAQQQKYLSEKSAEEIALAIERANDYAAAEEAKGEEVNLGALYQTAIMRGWGVEQKAKLENEAKKLERKQKTEQAKAEQKQQNEKAELDRTNLRTIAKRQFDAMTPTEQSSLVEEFGQTLKGFPLTTFKKSGITSAMLAPTFAMWLVDKLNLSPKSHES